jgi:hypothetical protein
VTLLKTIHTWREVSGISRQSAKNEDKRRKTTDSGEMSTLDTMIIPMI